MCCHQKIAGESCPTVHRVQYYCQPNYGYICHKEVCNDGTEGTPYCGYGSCNIFGYNCAGGCRQGTSSDAEQIYRDANPHIRFLPKSSF